MIGSSFFEITGRFVELAGVGDLDATS